MKLFYFYLIIHIEIWVSSHTTQMRLLWPQCCQCGITGMTHIICPLLRTSLLLSKAQQQPNKSLWCGITVCCCWCHEPVWGLAWQLLINHHFPTIVLDNTNIKKLSCCFWTVMIFNHTWLIIIGVIKDARVTASSMFWLILFTGFFLELFCFKFSFYTQSIIKTNFCWMRSGKIQNVDFVALNIRQQHLNSHLSTQIHSYIKLQFSFFFPKK